MNIEQYRDYARQREQPLSHSQELDLVVRILRGDNEATLQLADSQLLQAVKFVEMYHAKVTYKSIPIDELISAANNGLYRAAKSYSNGEGKAFRFKDYSAWWIKQSIGQINPANLA